MTEAMRANNGKPQLSYVLSFEGAERLLPGWLHPLAQWYRGESGIGSAVRAITNASPFTHTEAAVEIARVAEFGAIKYARGNYLLGRSWSDTCNSLLRHASKVRDGEHSDPESGRPHWGHILWNAVFLEHCVRTMPERDDRLRAPAPPSTPPPPPPPTRAGAPDGLHGYEPDGTEWRLNDAGDGYEARAFYPTGFAAPWVSGNSFQQVVAAARELVSR